MHPAAGREAEGQEGGPCCCSGGVSGEGLCISLRTADVSAYVALARSVLAPKQVRTGYGGLGFCSGFYMFIFICVVDFILR